MIRVEIIYPARFLIWAAYSSALPLRPDFSDDLASRDVRCNDGDIHYVRLSRPCGG
jgi:hypothetical protein